MPVFEHLASRLYYAGEVGNASKMKALHQISAAINHISSFEVLCAGVKCGFGAEVSLPCYLLSTQKNILIGGEIAVSLRNPGQVCVQSVLGRPDPKASLPRFYARREALDLAQRFGESSCVRLYRLRARGLT